jgi:hypothetical protein
MEEEDASEEEDDADAGPSFADRLEALQQQQQEEEEEEQGAAKGLSAPGEALPADRIKADSLAVLLTQALRSGDKEMLEKCMVRG